MAMHMRSALKVVLRNYYLLLGVIVGVFVNVSFIELECAARLPAHSLPAAANYTDLHVVVHANASRPGGAHHVAPTRPRYYSTELGMREQLFVGVLTSMERLHSHAAPANRTLAHLVDGVRFFVTAPRMRRASTRPPLAGVVGFPDGGRAQDLALQALRYIADHLVPDYDFFLLASDYTYVNARRLRHLASRISVSQHVYLGTILAGSVACDLDAGVLFSNSVVRAMSDHLDWCLSNGVSRDSSENVARCVHKALQVECQPIVQGAALPSYELRAADLGKHFGRLRVDAAFNGAVTVRPVVGAPHFHLLHAHFAHLELLRVRAAIAAAQLATPGSWPPGEPAPSRPATRFDVVRQLYFNRTHVFAADDFAAVRRHSRAEWLDLQNVLANVERHVGAPVSLVNGYRSFDMARGVDYVLDVVTPLAARRFGVCKPLGGVEFVGAPYVTESGRVAVLVHVEAARVGDAVRFLRRFDAAVLAASQERVLLMFALLYAPGAASHGADDAFAPLKTAARVAKVTWLSIRLPAAPSGGRTLRFAVVDLALKKLGVDSLLLLATVDADLSADFLNRVRMNTIRHHQVFAPMPYRFYDPQVAGYADGAQLEMSKSNGHFDRDDYDFVAFYGRDYVAARKRYKHLVPLTRVDADIGGVLRDAHPTHGDVFAMFVEQMPHLHALRAPDAALHVRYHPAAVSDERRNWFIGTRVQLASALLADA